jgi:hypothetical protein
LSCGGAGKPLALVRPCGDAAPLLRRWWGSGFQQGDERYGVVLVRWKRIIEKETTIQLG